MKIGIVTEFFSPYITGGAELFLESLAEYLTQEGFKIIVFTTEQNQRKGAFKTYKIKSSPFHFSYAYQFPGLTTYWMYFNSKLKKKFSDIYLNENIDALYINNLFHLSFAPLQAFQKEAIVLDVHDYWPICFSKDLYYCNRKFCNRQNLFKCAYCLGMKIKLPIISPFLLPGLCIDNYLKTRYLNNIRSVICHSDFVSKILSKRGFTNKVVPYPSLSEANEINIATEKDDVFKILFVGRLEKRKGADIVLDAASKLKDKMDFRIDVLGLGNFLKRLDRKDLNIYVHGFIKEPEKTQFFKNADCLLAPSRWPEPFGIVGLEAMAYNVPILTLESSGGLAELVSKTQSGLVSTNEQNLIENILSLSHARTFKKTVQKNYSNNIKKFNKEKIFNEYKLIFENLSI